MPMEPQPSTSTSTDYKSGLISLEMFNCAATDLNDKGVINMKKYQSISINHKEMNPHQLVGLVGPANEFAMNGLAMHFAQILIVDGHTLPLHLFMDVLTEKSQTLREFIKIQHVGLCLTANIRAQSATIRVYNMFTTNINLLLRFTIMNTLDLENHLLVFRFYS